MKKASEYRILAIDTGDKRLGFALWDPHSGLSRPLPARKRKSLKEDLKFMGQLCRQEAIDAFLVGYPQQDGATTSSQETAKFWTKRLSEEFGLPVWSVDESLSSIEAEQLLQGLSPEKKKERKDSWAAALFLERFIREQQS